MEEGFIRFEGVKKVYRSGEVELTALSDASFTIEKGEICVIVGESGAGKTTLLNILGGMDTLTLQAFFGAALSGEEMPIDVYDAASWMVITCLTEASIANGGMPIDIPDFTGGKWILREPKDVAELI